MNLKTATTLALTALTLGACSANDGRMAANGKICSSFKVEKAATSSLAPGMPVAGVDAAAPVDECLRRWAYSLASSIDPAGDVADATVAACGAQLTRWNQAGLTTPTSAEDNVQALSLTTGQPTNAVSEHYAFAQSRALLYVVQARAGRCAPPPAANGAPTGA